MVIVLNCLKKKHIFLKLRANINENSVYGICWGEVAKMVVVRNTR